MKDLERPVVLFAFTKVIIHKVRPVPGLPLSAADNVTHSEKRPERVKYDSSPERI